jgi:cytochrome c biogenesis protein CcdA
MEQSKTKESNKTKSAYEPKEKLVWDAPEFYYYPKNKYWIMGIATLVVGLVFVFIAASQYFHYEFQLSDYLVIIILALILVVFAQYGHSEPDIFQAELGPKGVFYRNHSYSYDSMKSFWIIEKPHPVLYLQVGGAFLPVSILLQEQSIEEVRSYLLRYIPEHPTAVEHVTDKLNHFLRF